MRISDWSSDVCSSDRVATETPPPRATLAPPVTANRRRWTRCVTPQFHIPRPALPGRPVKTAAVRPGNVTRPRSEEHTSELQSLMRISYAVFCLKNQKQQQYAYTLHILHYYDISI